MFYEHKIVVYRMWNGENLGIYDLLIIIDYFFMAFLSHRDGLSVAQTTALIGVNLCLTESYFEKTKPI